LNDLLNAADIHLLPQKKGAADLVMPSKLAGILSSGRPVVAMADEDTEIAYIVRGCGLLVPPEEPAPLRAAALRLVQDPCLRASLGSAARDYAVKHLGKDQVLERFERDILALVHPQERTKDVQLAQSYRG
jgi:colanic acid biosynthesis glycosyl transferase WcaI